MLDFLRALHILGQSLTWLLRQLPDIVLAFFVFGMGYFLGSRKFPGSQK